MNTFDIESNEKLSRGIEVLTRYVRDGSLPITAGVALLINGRRDRSRNTASRVLAAALIGIGIRQRRRRESLTESTAPGEGSHGSTGTVEQRADSHRGDENPRGTATDPEINQKEQSGERSVEFTDNQEESAASPTLETESGGDPRIDSDTTTVDISEAALADEASEATGPSSVQSQPTQTDAIEPEETPEEDSDMEDENADDTQA